MRRAGCMRHFAALCPRSASPPAEMWRGVSAGHRGPLALSGGHRRSLIARDRRGPPCPGARVIGHALAELSDCRPRMVPGRRPSHTERDAVTRGERQGTVVRAACCCARRDCRTTGTRPRWHKACWSRETDTEATMTLRQVTRPTRRRWGGTVAGRPQQQGPSWTSMTSSRRQRSRPTSPFPTRDGRPGMPSLTHGAVRGWRRRSGRALWRRLCRRPGSGMV